MKTDTDSQTEKLRWFSGWLEKFINYEAVKNTGGFSLETMRLLAEKAGNPQGARSSVFTFIFFAGDNMILITATPASAADSLRLSPCPWP